jgi:hypothetical protein
MEFQYRGGWTGQQTWSVPEGRWVAVAVKGARRVEQGQRTRGQLLDALDRLDGRSCFADFIAGIQAGLTGEEAKKPLPFGPDGEPLPAGAAPEVLVLAASGLPGPGPALALVGVQQSFFGGDEW